MAKRKYKGRPSKLTPKIQEVLCEGIELGMGYEQASLRAGITDRTRQNWVNAGHDVYEMLQENEEDTEVELTKNEYDYLRFFLAHEKAKAESQAYHLTLLENHAQHDPKVSQWILERRFPDDFAGIPNRVEHTGRDGGPIETADASGLTMEERTARLLAIFSAASERKNVAEQTADADDDPQ